MRSLRESGTVAVAIAAVLLVGCYDNQHIAAGPGGSGGLSSTGGVAGGAGTAGDSGGAPTSGGGSTLPTGGMTGIAGTSGTGGIAGSSGTSGIAGSSGTGGIAGTSGTSGIAGSSGSVGGAMGMACPSTDPVVGGALIRPNGTSYLNVSIPVSVTSVTPTSEPFDGKRAFQTITLTSAASEIWTFHVGMVDLPANLLTPGETVTLDVAYSSGVPVVTLSRAGRLVIFLYDYHAFMGPFLPDLSKFGVNVTDDGVSCTNAYSSCTLNLHRARVTVGGASQAVAPGTSATLGSLTVVLDRYQHSDCFDPDQALVIGGWQTP